MGLITGLYISISTWYQIASKTSKMLDLAGVSHNQYTKSSNLRLPQCSLIPHLCLVLIMYYIWPEK